MRNDVFSRKADQSSWNNFQVSMCQTPVYKWCQSKCRLESMARAQHVQFQTRKYGRNETRKHTCPYALRWTTSWITSSANHELKWALRWKKERLMPASGSIRSRDKRSRALFSGPNENSVKNEAETVTYLKMESKSNCNRNSIFQGYSTNCFSNLQLHIYNECASQMPKPSGWRFG